MGCKYSHCLYPLLELDGFVTCEGTVVMEFGMIYLLCWMVPITQVFVIVLPIVWTVVGQGGILDSGF